MTEEQASKYLEVAMKSGSKNLDADRASVGIMLDIFNCLSDMPVRGRDAHKMVTALRWLDSEMEQRVKFIEAVGNAPEEH